MIRQSGRADSKICHFDVFPLNFLQQNTVKLSLPVVRQPSPQNYLAFTLKQKDVLGTRLVETEWRSERRITDRRCNDVLEILETTFFDHWVKHYLWWLLWQPHWFINYFQCIIITSRSLELIYIRWLWAVQRKLCLFALKSLLFYICRIGAGGWCESDNFVIVALYFIKFNYWYGNSIFQSIS